MTKGVILPTQSREWRQTFPNSTRVNLTDGVVIIFSDAHWWPGTRTPAHEALLLLIERMKPKVVIANGDLVDGASTNRHDPHGWAERPTVKEEIETVDAHLHEIKLASPKGARFIWNIGNHDLNFERRLATRVPEFAGMPMVRLEDHFDGWEMQWKTEINDCTVVKHRYHNGIHAAYNNALKSGKTIVTGHLHRLAVTPWVDYNGKRWGVDTGTLANPNGPQFEYGEDNPKPHCSGFAVLTYKNGFLLPPELVEVINGRAYFRGEVIYE